MSVDTSALDAAKMWDRLSTDPELVWAIMGIDRTASGKTSVIINAMGDTGIAQMVEHLKDDQIQFCVFRVMGVDPKGAVVSRRAKFILFTWQGKSVPRLKLVQATPVKSAVTSYCRGHHVALEIDDRTDLTEVDIEKRLRACGGAHQPDHFEFGSGSTVRTFTAETQPVADSAPSPVPAAKAAAAPAPAPAPVAAPAPAPAPVPAPAPAPVPAPAPAPAPAPVPAPAPAPAPEVAPAAEPVAAEAAPAAEPVVEEAAAPVAEPAAEPASEEAAPATEPAAEVAAPAVVEADATAATTAEEAA